MERARLRENRRAWASSRLLPRAILCRLPRVAPPVPSPPIEPPRTRARFPDPRKARGVEVLAVGGDFSAGTLLAAYRTGIFPWPHSSGVVPWCSPEPRAIFPLEREPRWSRSLRRTLKKHPFEITKDVA